LSSDRVLAALDHLGVPYEVIPIDPQFADTEVFCRQYGYSLDRSANTILVASKKEPRMYAACVVLADSKLDVNGTVRKLMGVSRASFASAEEMRALTGMEVGGLTPFVLPTDVALYVDARIAPLDWIILGGGGRDLKIKVAPDVLASLGGKEIQGLGVPREASG
jgi:prolyl-tRNA editing enzyme YbaK/EbsC (Cys-tRNA(Pro) deacylase)